MADDPYAGLRSFEWPGRTRELLAAHPLDAEEVIEVVHDVWRRILTTRIAGELELQTDVRPSPQMMGNFLELVMVAEFKKRYPNEWREQQTKSEKDLVYIPDDAFSTEIKTSSSAKGMPGNRSYAQPVEVQRRAGTKVRDGYYISVNFQSFTAVGNATPRITRISMGWLSHADWRGQAQPTGQRADPTPEAMAGKMLRIF